MTSKHGREAATLEEFVACWSFKDDCLGCHVRQQQQPQERRRSACRRRSRLARWADVAERHQREDLRASYQGSPAAASAPVAASAPEPEPHAAAEARRRFVVPNVIDGQAPVVCKPWPTFADALRTYDRDYRRVYGAQLTEQQDKVLRDVGLLYAAAGHP